MKKQIFAVLLLGLLSGIFYIWPSEAERRSWNEEDFIDYVYYENARIWYLKNLVEGKRVHSSCWLGAPNFLHSTQTVYREESGFHMKVGINRYHNCYLNQNKHDYWNIFCLELVEFEPSNSIGE